ncbi:Nn.00g046230.m01.CDS01 [Neocucurbitaria sp. VM-36]
MTSLSPITLRSQPHSRPGRRSERAEVGEEVGKKPKKVNSEIRKQQNRIASRNYREKRKRKLQYLQDLIKDESNDQQESDPSLEQHEVFVRSLSADQEPLGPSSSPYMLSSNDNFRPTSSSGAPITESILAASATSFDNHHLSTTQTYPALGPIWNTPLYPPPQPLNMSPWNIPPWMPDIECTPRGASRSDALHYTAPTGPPVFAQAHVPSQQPREPLSDASYYAFGSAFGSHVQTPGIPNVSLPTSSSYYQGVFSESH